MKKEIKDLITGPVTFDRKRSSGLFSGEKLIGILTVSNDIRHMPEFSASYEKAVAFQDEVGQWIAEAINEKIEREANKMPSPEEWVTVSRTRCVQTENGWLTIQVEPGDNIIKASDVETVRFALEGYAAIILSSTAASKEESEQKRMVVRVLNRIIEQMS